MPDAHPNSHATTPPNATPATLDAANGVAVGAFLAGHIRFTRIAALVEETLERSNDAPRPASLDEVLAVDQSARRQAMSLLENTALV